MLLVRAVSKSFLEMQQEPSTYNIQVQASTVLCCKTARSFATTAYSCHCFCLLVSVREGTCCHGI